MLSAYVEEKLMMEGFINSYSLWRLLGGYIVHQLSKFFYLTFTVMY